MTSQLGWQMLKQRRDEAKVTMMYKILNHLVFMDHDLNFNTSQTQGQVNNVAYKNKCLP